MINVRTTELANFRDCPLRYKRAADTAPPPTAGMVAGTRAHEAFYDHLLKGRFAEIPERLHFLFDYFHITADNIEVEACMEFDVNLDTEPEITLWMHADLVTIANDTVYVCDLKSNAAPDSDYQILTYCTILARKYNVTDARAWYAIINPDNAYYKPFAYTQKDLERHEWYLQFLAERLYSHHLRDEWPASVGPWCDNCPFAGDCLQRRMSFPPFGFETLEAASEFKQLYKAAKKLDEAASDMIKADMLRKGEAEREIAGKKYSLSTSNTLR